MKRISSVLGWVALAAMVPLFVSGCGGPAESEVAFDRLSGEVHLAESDEYVLQLLVVAPENDPVWSGIWELVVANDAPDGGDLVFGGNAAQLTPGAEQDGLRAGTIDVPIPEDEDTFELSTVRIAVNEGDELTEHDVGTWVLSRDAEQ